MRWSANKTEHLPAPRLRQAGNAVGRFSEPGDEELLADPSRNFQIFDPLDFLAEVTLHIRREAFSGPRPVSA